MADSEYRWDQYLTEDPKFKDLSFVGASSYIPKRNRVLQTKIADKGLICNSEGNIYVFHVGRKKWCVVPSKQAIVYLNNMMELDSATVKYVDAYEPYSESLEEEASKRVAQRIPQSVCIGKSRLRVNLTRDKLGLELRQCESLLHGLPDDMSKIADLCYMSLHVTKYPLYPNTWQRTKSYNIYRFLSILFTDPNDMLTLEWCLGNSLLDPHSFSKAVLLYGEGGHGKSTLISTLHSIFKGCCASIPDKSLVSLTKGMTTEVATAVISNRIVTAGDVGGLEENTNLSVVKSITGHDYISIPPSQVKTACTLVYGSNRLDDPKKNLEWVTPAIMRRVVVLLMNATIPEGLDSRIPQDEVSRLDFALRCVHTRLSNPYMPISSTTVLITLMGSKFHEASQYIAPIEDDMAEEDEIINANAIVAGYLSIEIAEVGELAKRISASSTVSIKSILYIKNIVPSNEYYSSHGHS